MKREKPGNSPDHPAWRTRVARALRAERGGVVIVAVSGGGDSVALVRIVAALAPELALRPVVAHLNHGARGAESEADAAFTHELAGALGLPCEHGRWSADRRAHFEADARRARLGWLTGVARRHGARAVLLGHTRDDQAETILHRIVRGTGPRGLSGIPGRRPLTPAIDLVRPLLAVSRAELRAYLEALGQPWREDRTNHDTRQTRARIRHDLLPRLTADFNPRVVEALVRLGRLAAAEGRARDRRLGRLVRAARPEPGPGDSPDSISLPLDRIGALGTAERAEALRLAWRAAGLPERAMTARHWQRLATLAGRGVADRLLPLPGVLVSRQGGVLHLIRREPEATATAAAPPEPAAPVAAVTLPCPGSVAWGGGRLAITPVAPDEPAPASDGTCEWIDRDALAPFGRPEAPELLVRAAAVGDRFAPLGLGGHSKPLADFFRGRRIPWIERAAVPLVCDQRGIVWVAGHRIADRVRLTDGTRQPLALHWQPAADS